MTTIQYSKIIVPNLDFYRRLNIVGICVIYVSPDEDKSLIIKQQIENSIQAKLIEKISNIPLIFFQ